jgi:signal transduction histidine kinase
LCQLNATMQRMNTKCRTGAPIERGARYHYGIGVALISVVPILTLMYLVSRVYRGIETSPGMTLGVSVIALGLALLGHVILHKYPASVERLREYTGRLAEGNLSDGVELPRQEGDIAAIEESMNKIVAQLKRKVEKLEVERELLRGRLFKIQRIESLGLMAGGVAQAFEGVLDELDANVRRACEAAVPGSGIWTALESIGQSASQARARIAEMAMYAGHVRTAPEALALSPVVAEMIELVRTYLVADRPIECELAESLPPIRGDTTLVQQAASALILRAVRAADEAAVRVATGVADYTSDELADAIPEENVRAGRWVYLEVSDQGPALDEKTRAHLFEPFFAGGAGPAGAGLSVVLGIARAHGGLVTVECGVGCGTAIRLLFPTV